MLAKTNTKSQRKRRVTLEQISGNFNKYKQATGKNRK